jgi:hypothetical protein
MGIARVACAITLAIGVKSNSRKPSGPERDSARYSTNPTTTGGRPKNALTRTTIIRRPRKGTIARAVPKGKLTAAAKAVAAKLTPIESPTISKKSRNSIAMVQADAGRRATYPDSPDACLWYRVWCRVSPVKSPVLAVTRLLEKLPSPSPLGSHLRKCPRRDSTKIRALKAAHEPGPR